MSESWHWHHVTLTARLVAPLNVIPVGATGICTADLPEPADDVFAVWFDRPFRYDNGRPIHWVRFDQSGKVHFERGAFNDEAARLSAAIFRTGMAAREFKQ